MNVGARALLPLGFMSPRADASVLQRLLPAA